MARFWAEALAGGLPGPAWRATAHLLDGLGRLLGVVVGDAVVDVVQDVGVRDAVPQRVEDTEGAVDGGELAAHGGEGALAVVGDVRVGVLQVGDGHEVVVDDEVGDDVVARDGGEAKGVDAVAQDAEGREEGHVALHHEPEVCGARRRVRGRAGDDAMMRGTAWSQRLPLAAP